MLEKVKEFFLQKGFMRLAIREAQVEVVFRLVKDGLYFVCFIDDTEGFLVDDRAGRIRFLRVGVFLQRRSFAGAQDDKPGGSLLSSGFGINGLGIALGISRFCFVS